MSKKRRGDAWMPAPQYARTLEGLTVNLLVRDISVALTFHREVLKAEIIYSDPAQADAWGRKPNRHFGGQTPIERMAAGDVTDLAAVRVYLDAARAPWS